MGIPYRELQGKRLKEIRDMSRNVHWILVTEERRPQSIGQRQE
jgi:hypothetical protein